MMSDDTPRGGLVPGMLARPAIFMLARIAIAVPFLLSGAVKLLDFGGAVAEVRALAGVEPASVMAVLVIGVQLAGSCLVIAGGRYAWIGAGLLAGFTAVATLIAHAFWLKPATERALHQNIFFEHVSIIGGLLLVAAVSADLAARDRRARN